MNYVSSLYWVFQNRFYYILAILISAFSSTINANIITTPFGDVPSAFSFKDMSGGSPYHVKITMDSESKAIIANIDNGDNRQQIKLSPAVIRYLKSLDRMEDVDRRLIFFALIVANTLSNIPVATDDYMTFVGPIYDDYHPGSISISGNNWIGIHSMLYIELDSSDNGFFPIYHYSYGYKQIINYVINVGENNLELETSRPVILLFFLICCFCCSKYRCASSK